MEYPNWFARTGQATFEAVLPAFAAAPATFLQIGAYTGDASLWMLEHALIHSDSRLVDVDTWGGSDEVMHADFDWDDVERTYVAKIAPHAAKVRSVKMTSDEFFAQSRQTFPAGFDFIYVDGDHEALPVLRDGVNAFANLKVGGILAFDDYTWNSGKGPFFDPGPAINAFYGMFAPYIEVLNSGLQFWVRKVGTPPGRASQIRL